MPLPVAAANSQTTYAAGVLRVVVHGEVIVSVAKLYAGGEIPLVPLRVVCEYLGGSVSWDAARKTAAMDYNGGRYTLGGVVQQGSLMVSPGKLSAALNLPMRYEPSLSVVVFGHGAAFDKKQLMALLPRYGDYAPEDVHWLSRIVEAEARGETYESRLAVASVVLNRLAAPQYPDTVKAVIFDDKHGVQFTPTVNGAINRDASTLSFLAALDALDGHNNAPGALFFLSPALATNFWVQKNRQFAFTIGGHAYYY
jgi:N-acetylmuramoyl-L-alanine amidase